MDCEQERDSEEGYVLQRNQLPIGTAHLCVRMCVPTEKKCETCRRVLLFLHYCPRKQRTKTKSRVEIEEITSRECFERLQKTGQKDKESATMKKSARLFCVWWWWWGGERGQWRTE